MTEPWILASLATTTLAAITTLLALLPHRSGSASAALVGGIATATAAAVLLGTAADAGVWGSDAVMSSIANGSHRVDPRVFASLALALVTLVALPGLLRGLGAARPGLVSSLTPGAVIAMLVTASAAFLGLRATEVLTVAALGAFCCGVALSVAVRATPLGGRLPWSALVVTGAALTAVAVTLTVYGAKSEPLEINQGESADAFGAHVTYHGEVPVTGERKRLAVTLRDGKRERRLEPEFWHDPNGLMHGRGAGDWFAGAVVVPIGLREIRPSGHPVDWLKQGDTLEVPGGSLRFDGFRVEGRDTIRIFADLTVTRGTTIDHISPGVIATHHGEEPFAAAIGGLGQVAVAGIDADQKRVGLVLPPRSAAPVSSTAAFLIRMRPTLPGAWAGVLLALVAALAGLRSRRPGRGSAAV
ncbi:MAG: hypothetical protein ACHQ52_05445 [Candidatus Eisenbacteria bacterium]